MKWKTRLRISAQVVAALAFAASMNSASAGYIVAGAIITSVANTSANQRNFSVSVTSGSGPRAETTIIFEEGTK